MQIIFLFIILILSQKILTEENDISIEINKTKNIFFENKIYELNDTSFEDIITEGKIYRWFILFYSNSYINCKKAKEEIQKIFDSYNSLNEIRFAQMDIDENIMTKIRLDIKILPYIILLENNTIYEMNSELNHENIEDFIFVFFSDTTKGLKPLPEKIKYSYMKWIIFKQNLDDYIDNINKSLFEKGINIHFNLPGLIIALIISIILFLFLLKLIINYCFKENYNIQELKELAEDFDKRKDEIAEEEEKMKDINDEDIILKEEMMEYLYEYEEEEDDEDEEMKKKRLIEEKKRLEEERKKILEQKKKKNKKIKKKIKKDKINDKNKDE